MTTLFLYDDARARSFEPFASSRPISEMLAGAALLIGVLAEILFDRTALGINVPIATVPPPAPDPTTT